ncbi:MAG: Uncharacterized protein G01um101417_112 [Parcubacteria group bacterium Gr01-1014_17]|nr:MAG: Uncharacterized protein G01um101417_112 [Parcubacteria group bacterium Gr01-1014_17]
MSKNTIKDIRANSNVLYKVTDYPDMSFIGGKYLIFLVKKVENFVRAIYLITNFLSDSEPLKWKLRTVATELIDRVMSFIRDDKNKANEPIHRAHFLGCLSVLVSLLNVGEEGGAVSEANTSLLKHEIQSFFPIFNVQIFKMKGGDIALPIAKIQGVSFRRKQVRGRPRGTRKLSVRDYENELISPIQNMPPTNNVLYESHGQKEVSILVKKDTTKNIRQIRLERRFARQKAIIDALKDKKKLTVKEILSFINDCGEKTIQRELYELVDRGVLKKLGEKRWSSYSFVQPLLFEREKDA